MADILLPICFLFPFFLAAMLLWRKGIPDLRDRFLTAAIAWGFVAIVLTEGLSVLNLLVPWAVCVCWLMCTALVVVSAKHVRIGKPAAPFTGDEPAMLLSPVILIAIVIGIAAWIGPPNNWDSMSYHLPRVLHWIQNKNVAFYPTGCGRQLEMPPCAEYLILQFQILCRGDRWTDMIQWFAYVGSVVGVSVIARSLGGAQRSQLLAMVFAGTIPMACLQSQTAQNDLVSAFWFICFLVTAIRLCSDFDWTAATLCGMSLGLALLTKSTMYILTAPFCAGLALLLLWRIKHRAIPRFIAVAIIALSLNVPTYVRNHRFTHSYLGNGGFGLAGGLYTNAHPGVAATVSNIIRNLGLEFAVDLPNVMPTIENTVRGLHHLLHLNIDDPSTTLGWVASFDLVHTIVWSSADYAAGPIHVLLIAAALLTMLVSWRYRAAGVRWYGLALLGGFVLFCGYLRYQPWHCRLHLPMLIAFAPFVAVVMDRHWKPIVSVGVTVLLPLCAIPCVLLNSQHPLTGYHSILSSPREDRYFLERDLHWQYRTITDFAEKNHVTQIAIIGDGNCWEYPLQMMMRQRLGHVRFEAYPGKYTLTADMLHTRNLGYENNGKPWLVVQLTGNTAEVVKLE